MTCLFNVSGKQYNRILTVAALVFQLTSISLPLNAWSIEEKEPCVTDYLKTRLSMFADGFKKKLITERDPDLMSDLGYLEEKKAQQALGIVATEYDPKFKTRVHYTATARPLPDGSIPRVDPEARANFIYFHGSGTQAAGGNTFIGKQNSLASVGYTSIGFDYPWHKDGPVSRDMLKSETFLKWLDEFIQAHRVEGQPVYLVGHSFGPTVIREYIRRYPKGVNGVQWLSGPMDSAPELEAWSENELKRMQQFWQDTKSNEKGGTWASIFSRDAAKDAHKYPDPTENPDFKLRVLIGKDEEYIPKPLDANGLPIKGAEQTFDFCAYIKRFFKNATCIVEPDVGHMIFAHRDANGDDIIMRELMALNGDDIRKTKEMKQTLPRRLELDTFAQMYRREPLFRKWFDAKYGHDTFVKWINEKDNKAIRTARTDWKTVLDQRGAELVHHIKATEQWAPDFYWANKAEIDALDPMSRADVDTSKVVTIYRDLLKTQKPEILAKHATATDQIFVIPERQPKPERPVKVAKEKPAKEKPAQPEQAATSDETAKPNEAVAPGDATSPEDPFAVQNVDPNRKPSSHFHTSPAEPRYRSSIGRADYLLE